MTSFSIHQVDTAGHTHVYNCIPPGHLGDAARSLGDAARSLETGKGDTWRASLLSLPAPQTLHPSHEGAFHIRFHCCGPFRFQSTAVHSEELRGTTTLTDR